MSAFGYSRLIQRSKIGFVFLGLNIGLGDNKRKIIIVQQGIFKIKDTFR